MTNVSQIEAFNEQMSQLHRLLNDADVELADKSLIYDETGPQVVEYKRYQSKKQLKQNFKLTGHKLAYKMDRPKPINLRNDYLMRT